MRPAALPSLEVAGVGDEPAQLLHAYVQRDVARELLLDHGFAGCEFVAQFQDRPSPYVINWDSIACDSRDFLVMGNPFETYNDEVDRFLSKPRTVTSATDQQL